MLVLNFIYSIVMYAFLRNEWLSPTLNLRDKVLKRRRVDGIGVGLKAGLLLALVASAPAAAKSNSGGVTRAKVSEAWFSVERH